MNHKRSLEHPQIVLLLLCLIALISYGELILDPGLFGDDPVLLSGYLQDGADGIDRVLGWSRPNGTWVYKAILPLLGTQVIYFQLLSILLRTLGAWAFYLVLAEARPEWRQTAGWAALACLVYPGFTQQAHALQFLLHWVALAATLFSIWLMLKAEDCRSRLRQNILKALSLILAAGIFTTEYFVGLELLRPVLLWMRMRQKYHGRQALATTAMRWLPYALILAWMITWRLFFADISYPQPLLLTDIGESPFKAVEQIAVRAASDIWLGGAAAWGSPLKLIASGTSGWQAILAGILALGLLWLFYTTNSASTIENISGKRGLILAGVGFAAMLAGGAPLWISRTPLSLTFPWSRTTLCLMAGACMMAAGAACLLPSAWRCGFLALLTGLSVCFQNQTSRGYLDDWEDVRQIFWQLAWRAPGLQPGTLVLFEHLPITFYSANSLDPILNLTYNPQGDGTPTLYRMFEISERLGSVLPALQPGLEIRHGSFTGSTSQALVITWGDNGCLEVLEPDSLLPPGTDPLLWSSRRISSTDVIQKNVLIPARPPDWLGAEPDHGACHGRLTHAGDR